MPLVFLLSCFILASNAKAIKSKQTNNFLYTWCCLVSYCYNESLSCQWLFCSFVISIKSVGSWMLHKYYKTLEVFFKGERFRVKFSLPECYTDIFVAKFLIRFVSLFLFTFILRSTIGKMFCFENV